MEPGGYASIRNTRMASARHMLLIANHHVKKVRPILRLYARRETIKGTIVRVECSYDIGGGVSCYYRAGQAYSCHIG